MLSTNDNTMQVAEVASSGKLVANSVKRVAAALSSTCIRTPTNPRHADPPNPPPMPSIQLLEHLPRNARQVRLPLTLRTISRVSSLPHRVLVFLLLKVVVFVVVVIEVVARVLGRLGEVDGLAARAPTVGEDVVRIDFAEVVVLFFVLGCRKEGGGK